MAAMSGLIPYISDGLWALTSLDWVEQEDETSTGYKQHKPDDML